MPSPSSAVLSCKVRIRARSQPSCWRRDEPLAGAPSMWIKICGMTTPEAVAACLKAQVDAIGFVFAPSPRRLSPQRAHQLAAPARGRVRCVAVTRHPTQADLQEILAVFAPDIL